MKKEKITIETLAEMTHNEFRRLEGRLDQMVTKELFKEGFDVLLSEIKGLRGDLSNYRAGTHIEYAEILERVEALENHTGLKHRK
mgnify:FL=1